MNDPNGTGDGVREETKPKLKKSGWARELLGWVEAIVGAVIIVALIVTFVGRPILVDGHSMENTLMDRDRIIITPLYRELKHNDVVVIRRKGDTPLVKRVIALAGDTIDFDWDNHAVILNGEVLDEPFIREPVNLPLYSGRMLEFPATVPEGHIFVMGDNRNNSSDSRDQLIGMIDVKNVMGKAVFRMWPLDKIGGLEDYTY